MVVVGNQAREDSQDGELGVDDQQLENQAVQGEQPEGAEEEEEPQGNSDEENPVEDGVQDDPQEEDEAGARESSGVAGKRPFSPDLKTRVKQLEQLVADLVAGKMKQATSFQGVKLRPADPSKYAGENKDVIKDWLATMVQWLGSGMCVPEQRVGLAQTFLTRGAASLWLRVLYSKPRALISRIGMSLPGPWSRPLVTRIQSRMQGTSWMP
jgi:hypothetical protein